MENGPDVDDVLMTTSRIITAAVVRSLTGVDPQLSMPQLRVLVMVSGAGGMTVNAVAAGLGVNASNASRTCERLVASGLLRRHEDAADRRRVVLRLSPRGRRIVDAVMDRRRAELTAVVDHLPAADQRRLAEALAAFNAAATQVAPEACSPDSVDQHLLAWLD